MLHFTVTTPYVYIGKREVKGMPWTSPKFSRSQVDAAGETLLAQTLPDTWGRWEEYEDALAVSNNWRLSHGYPL
jgi:hypothetical protein